MPETWRMYRRARRGARRAGGAASGVRLAADVVDAIVKRRRGRWRRRRVSSLHTTSRRAGGWSSRRCTATPCGWASASAWPHADAVRRLRRARAARRRRATEARLSRPVALTPAREVWRCVAPLPRPVRRGHRVPGRGTGLSLAIPWTVKQAIDALQRRRRGRAARPLRRPDRRCAPPATASPGWPRGSRSPAARSTWPPTCCARLYAARADLSAGGSSPASPPAT